MNKLFEDATGFVVWLWRWWWVAGGSLGVVRCSFWFYGRMSDRDADFLFDEETEGDADGEVEGGEEVIVCRACGESEREGGVLLDSSLATAEEEENVWEKETDVGLKDEEFHLPLLGVFSAAVSLFFVASVEHAIVDSRRKVVSMKKERLLPL